MRELKVKISIITVVYNAVETIERTIQSVLQQNYDNVEYIIIDGGSTDGTLNIVSKYKDKISYWISEPDDGIYDAMNKGIDISTGDYIYFLGADDWLFSATTLTEVCLQLDKSPFDIFCGKVMVIDKKMMLKKVEGKLLSTSEIIRGGMYPHQGMFVRKSLFDNNKFNSKLKIAADFENLIIMIKNGAEIKFCDLIVAYFSYEGASSNGELCKKEYTQIIKKHGNLKDVESYRQRSTSNVFFKVAKRLFIYIGLWRVLKQINGWNKVKNKDFFLWQR